MVDEMQSHGRQVRVNIYMKLMDFLDNVDKCEFDKYKNSNAILNLKFARRL